MIAGPDRYHLYAAACGTGAQDEAASASATSPCQNARFTGRVSYFVHHSATPQIVVSPYSSPMM